MFESQRKVGSRDSSVWVSEGGKLLNVWIRDSGDQKLGMSLRLHAGDLSSTTADERLDIRQGFLDVLGDGDVKELIAILAR